MASSEFAASKNVVGNSHAEACITASVEQKEKNKGSAEMDHQSSPLATSSDRQRKLRLEMAQSCVTDTIPVHMCRMGGIERAILDGNRGRKRLYTMYEFLSIKNKKCRRRQ